jgi:ribosomal-protein-alanine N-acetyltransferase
VEGAVEIAYYTFPGFESQGIATAMAAFLIERARMLQDVTRVIAHTLREPNASTRVLEKVGMRFAGEAVDDGTPAWRWEIELAPDIK